MESPAPAGGANEDLVSIKGKRVVQMTEVCSKDKLSASAVKEATGGDQQSARGLYQKKQKFVCVALLHVLCNSVPVFNDEDGGTTRRLRCIEYGSTFVDAAALNDDKYRGLSHVYEKQEGLGAKFESLWKYYLMYEVMRAAVRRVHARRDPSARKDLPSAPESVLAATRHLVERESTASTFIARHLLATNARLDIVTLNELYAEYERMCRDDGNKTAKPKGAFKEDLLGHLGPCANKLRGERNLWRGWKIVDGGDSGPAADEPGDDCA
jgi:phage/plasmid-associated DNA primase